MNNNFGRNFRFLRKKLGLTQTELGEKLGKAKTTIASYEQAKNNKKKCCFSPQISGNFGIKKVGGSS